MSPFLKCRALAAAIFGQDFDSKLQLREASPFTRFHMLQNDEVDVLAAHTTLTMQRDVYEVRVFCLLALLLTRGPL